MNYKDLNENLRGFCMKLINGGYTRARLCSLILGKQKQPMFNSFIEDTEKNFGIGVLSQIFEGFGYELLVLPVSKNEKNLDPKIQELYNKFTENYQNLIREGLSNINVNPVGRPIKNDGLNSVIKNISNNLLDEIGI